MFLWVDIPKRFGYTLYMDTTNTNETLTTGRRYEVDTLRLLGWTEGDGSGAEGYNFKHYFGPTGAYLGPDEHGIEPLFDHVVLAGAPTHQTFIAHYAQAAAWVRYNSRTGKATEKQILKVMRQLSPSDLTRMLAERGIVAA